ncbi:MAG: hypothetical protein ACI837_001627 [Crocinitomicaceae bacterium]|jgi:hypothetical protein
MKKITLIVASIFCAIGLQAQIMTEDFDALTVGDYIGVVSPTYWTTWSGTVGGAEDAQVNATEASSGANSIYFSSSAAGGGPQDVVVDFGTQYTDGVFTYENAFYIEAGKGAYYNFQATPVIGTTWAMNVNMSGGMLSIDDGVTSNLATASYTDATWFTLTIEANLTLNIWKASVDGIVIGVWANGINTIASCDIFPLQGHGFYVDDVMFDHQAYTLSTLNAAAAGFSMGGNIAGLNVYPTATVANGGTTPITSYDLTVNYNGNNYVENVTGVNIASTASLATLFTTPIPLVTGALPVTCTISNVNGTTDDVASDDVIAINVDPVSPAAGKVVVGEEATGTWCQWCPRGAVFMDQFAADFGPFWAGIAVHNGDPMTVVEYDAGIGTLIGGYPSALVDRLPEVDPSAMSNDFFTRLQIAPAAQMTTGATWDAGTRVLEVSVTAVFDQAASDTYKMLCVLTEDGVTGTTPDYNQANAYAGGGNGVMGGYESLPSSVPAAQMVYDHVARAITPSFTGDNTCFPATIAIGDSVTNNYSWTLPATWDENEVKIIGILADPTGKFDNASVENITGAVANGFVPSCALTVGEILATEDVLTVYPNPASAMVTIRMNVQNESNVQLRLIDMSGKQISSVDYGTISVASQVDLNTSNLEAGVYLVELTVNGERITKRLVIR